MLGVPIIRIIVVWGLSILGPPISGNYHLGFTQTPKVCKITALKRLKQTKTTIIILHALGVQVGLRVYGLGFRASGLGFGDQSLRV